MGNNLYILILFLYLLYLIDPSQPVPNPSRCNKEPLAVSAAAEAALRSKFDAWDRTTVPAALRVPIRCERNIGSSR